MRIFLILVAFSMSLPSAFAQLELPKIEPLFNGPIVFPKIEYPESLNSSRPSHEAISIILVASFTQVLETRLGRWVSFRSEGPDSHVIAKQKHDVEEAWRILENGLTTMRIALRDGKNVSEYMRKRAGLAETDAIAAIENARHAYKTIAEYK